MITEKVWANQAVSLRPIHFQGENKSVKVELGSSRKLHKLHRTAVSNKSLVTLIKIWWLLVSITGVNNTLVDIGEAVYQMT